MFCTQSQFDSNENSQLLMLAKSPELLRPKKQTMTISPEPNLRFYLLLMHLHFHASNFKLSDKICFPSTRVKKIFAQNLKAAMIGWKYKIPI